MVLYSTISILVAVVISCTNIAIFNKYKILRKDSIFIISLVSVVLAVFFPIILSGFIMVGTSTSFNIALVTSIITCLSLIIVISAIVAYREYIIEKGKKIFNWDKGVFLKELKKIGSFKEFVISCKNIRSIWCKLREPSTQANNEIVDCKPNIDTIGIEGLSDDILFQDSNITNQKSNKASESSPWDMDNPTINSFTNDYDTVMDLDGYSFVSNCEDNFNEQVLKESLCFENEYTNEMAKSDEPLDENFFDSLCYSADAVDFDPEELTEQSHYEYLMDSINKVINEIAPSDQNEGHTDFGDLDIYNFNSIDLLSLSDELIAAQREEGIEDNQVMNNRTYKAGLEKSLDEIINEGFKLKEQGDYEGAIINFLYALDSHPANDVARWIVLDICVMYKQLGQVDLAKEVLNSYIKDYGIIMDDALKYEIELNLQ